MTYNVLMGTLNPAHLPMFDKAALILLHYFVLSFHIVYVCSCSGFIVSTCQAIG